MAYKKWTASAEQLKPDPRFGSKLVSKFINSIMWDGKKSIAQGVFYGAMDLVEEKIKDAPALEVFEKAVENVKPRIEVRSRRVGGQNYQVPMQRQAQAFAGDPVDSRRGPRGQGPADFSAPGQ